MNDFFIEFAHPSFLILFSFYTYLRFLDAFNDHFSIAVYNLFTLNQLDLSQDKRIINVYRRNSRSEMEKCITAVKKLIKKLDWLKDKWPEMVVLDGIIQVMLDNL